MWSDENGRSIDEMLEVTYRRALQIKRHRALTLSVSGVALVITVLVAGSSLLQDAPGSTSFVGPTASEEIPSPDEWQRYRDEESGVSFEYPPLPGGVETQTLPWAKRIAWMTFRPADEDGIRTSYEFAAMNDACPATEGWPTYARSWRELNDAYQVSHCDGESRPLAIGADAVLGIVTRDDGGRALIYDATAFLEPQIHGEFPGARVAVLNFSSNAPKDYIGIAFYFEELTPLEDIERVIHSVVVP